MIFNLLIKYLDDSNLSNSNQLLPIMQKIYKAFDTNPSLDVMQQIHAGMGEM